MGRILGMAEHSAKRQEVAGNGNRKGDAALITALAAGHSIKEAAKIAGVGERTAHRRLDDPAFKERVSEMRTEFLSEAVGRLSDATTEAAKTLRSLLESKSDSVRLSAARSILEFAPKLRETVELERRLAALEAEMENK
jgi:transposase